jgi:hypothetical protein
MGTRPEAVLNQSGDVTLGWQPAFGTIAASSRAHRRRGNAYQNEHNRDASTLLLTFNPDTGERELAACATEPVQSC